MLFRLDHSWASRLAQLPVASRLFLAQESLPLAVPCSAGPAVPFSSSTVQSSAHSWQSAAQAYSRSDQNSRPREPSSRLTMPLRWAALPLSSTSRTHPTAFPSQRTRPLSPARKPLPKRAPAVGFCWPLHLLQAGRLGPAGPLLMAGARLRSAACSSREALTAAGVGCHALGVREYHAWYHHSLQSDRGINAMQSVEELAGYWSAYGRTLTYVNLAVFLRRLSLLVHRRKWNTPVDDPTASFLSRRTAAAAAAALPTQPASELQSAALAKMMAEVGAVVRFRSKWFEPHHGSMVLQYTAMLQHTDATLVDRVLARITARIGEAYSVDLARAALALMAHKHPGAPAWWDAAAAALTAKLPTGRVPPSCISGLLMPMLRLGHTVPPTLATAVAADLSARYQQYSLDDLSRSLWVLAKVQPRRRPHALLPLTAGGSAAADVGAAASGADASLEAAAEAPASTPAAAAPLLDAAQLDAISHRALVLATAHQQQSRTPEDSEADGAVAVGHSLRSFVNAVGQVLPKSHRPEWRRTHGQLLSLTATTCLPLLSGHSAHQLTELATALARVGQRPDAAFLSALSQAVVALPNASLSPRHRLSLSTAFQQLGAVVPAVLLQQ